MSDNIIRLIERVCGLVLPLIHDFFSAQKERKGLFRHAIFFLSFFLSFSHSLLDLTLSVAGDETRVQSNRPCDVIAKSTNQNAKLFS